MINDEELVPELKEWRTLNSEDFSITDWTAIEGSVQLAIGYSELYWPEFIEHDECVFLKSHFSIGNYDNWLQVDYVNYYAQIENVINHIHLMDWFVDSNKLVDKKQLIYLGRKLTNIYQVKLSNEFTNKKFEVSFNSDNDSDDLMDYELSFWQTKNEKREIKTEPNKIKKQKGV